MKRITSAILLLLFMLLNSQTAFAAAFDLVESYPADGTGGYHSVNMMVKLYFNTDVYAEDLQKNHEDSIVLKDANGTVIETMILRDPKYPNSISVNATTNLENFTEYTLTIAPDLEATNGDILGTEKKITFTTRDTSKDNRISMILMFVMMAVLIGATMLNTRRELKKEQKEPDKVNPYKVAKKKGVAVEKVVEKSEKEKEKIRKQNEIKEREKAKVRKKLEKKKNRKKVKITDQNPDGFKKVSRKYHKNAKAKR